MSVNMYVSASRGQASSVASMCRKQIEGYEQLQRAIEDFSVNSPMLTGAAYDSAKEFFTSVLQPLARGGTLLSEAVMEACQKFPDEYVAQVDSGDLRESDLREKIAQIDRLTSELADLNDRLHGMLFRQQQEGALDGSIASKMSSNQSLMATYHRARQKLQEKLDDLLTFNERSPAIFSEISTLEEAVSKGGKLAKGSWDSSLSQFRMPKSENMEWAATIANSWLIRDNKAKGIDPAKVEELKEYDVYGKLIIDSDGNPQVFWQLMKDGKGVKNRELYRYLKKAGQYLDPSMFEFITLDQWDKMVKEGFKKGLNIETGDEYKGLLKGVVVASQTVENGYTWATESELAQALQILGFTYASYRMASMPAKTKVAGADSPKNVVLHEKYKGVLETTEKANPHVESLRNTGKLPDNFISKNEAIGKGWRPGKAIENYVPGGQIGGDVYRNTTKILPDKPGRIWYEADVGLVGNMSRAKQPGSRLLYSSDGLLYVTNDHYNSMHFIGNY